MKNIIKKASPVAILESNKFKKGFLDQNKPTWAEISIPATYFWLEHNSFWLYFNISRTYGTYLMSQ